MKKKVIGFISKFLAIFLSGLFIAEILPLQIMAEAYREQVNSSSYINNLIENPNEDQENASDILYEVVEKRDEYTKVYKKTDGSYTAFISKTPIHFLDNGVWEEINNSLISSNGMLTNVNSSFDILFPSAISDDKQITVESGDSQISFSVNDIDSSVGNVENSIADFDIDNEEAGEALANTKSSVTYKDACDGTDIQYTVLPNAVKENIIVSSKEDLKSTYSFEFQIGTLDYILKEDGSIDFTDGDKVRFSIPRPVMTDSNYGLSYDVGVAISNNNDGTITLTYTPSKAWTDSSNRVYPVNIDPAIVITEDSYCENAFVLSDEPTANYYNNSMAIIGSGKILDEETGEIVSLDFYSELYVKFDIDSIKCLTEAVTPTNVQLVSFGGGKNIAAYEILEECDFQNVTYETKPAKSATPLDFYTGKDNFDDAEPIHFDITELFDNWLNGRRPNLGIAIAGYNDSVPASALLFTRDPYGTTYLMIDYVETSGYNDAYSYQQNDILCAGTSYINNFSRQLFIKRNDISIDGNIMPVEISFMYNTAVFQKQNATSPYGNNWLTNYNRIIYLFENDLGQSYLCYADENGSISYFSAKEDENGNLIFTDEFEDVFGDSGISVICNDPTDGNEASLADIQISNNGYTESFDYLGRLVKISNKNGKSIEIIYANETDPYKISKIKDGVGREYRFTYSNGLLSAIQCYNAGGAAIYAGSSTSAYLKNEYYYDDNGNLTKVNYPEGSNAYYTYDTKNRLSSASNRNLYKLSYSYTSYNRISLVTEYARENTLALYTKGNCIYYSSYGPREVQIKDSYGKIQDVQFDKCGLVSQIVDEKGNVYNSDTGILAPGSQNLLLNTSFENSTANWNFEGDTLPVIDSGNAYHGSNAVKFNLNNPESDLQNVSQSVSVQSGGSYTFSAYVKATETSADSNAVMQITAYEENGDETASNVRFVPSIANGYKRYDLVLVAPENTKRIEVTIGVSASSGTFYIDAFQLENQSGAGNYNMLANGAFNDGINGWSYNSIFDIHSADINGKSRNYVSYAKSYDADIKMSQTVTVNAKKGDIVSFGGWIKSNTVSNDGNNSLGILNPENTNFLGDRFAGLVITYQYYSTNENGENVLNTVVEKKAVNDYVNGWQYLDNSIVMLADAEAVTVSFEFKKHKSDVCVSDLSLTMDSMGYEEIAEEPESGENTENGETAGEITEPDSFNSQLDTENSCKCSHCTNPRCTCTCVNENLCTCQSCRKMFDIQYDDNGNILSITICGYELSELQSINIERTYSADGNYLTSSKNENGGIVRYAYNTNNGLLTAQKDARGNTTNYTYSLSGKVTKTEKTVSDLTDSSQMSTSYGYTNGNLTTVTHNGFSYYIEYDKWNNIERVSSHEFSALMNSCSVAAYTYSESNHSQLQKITYGNKGTVDYTYDEFGRVSAISYDGGVTNTFEYTYDTLGNVISVIDNSTGRKIYCCDGVTSVFTEKYGLIYYAGTDADGNEFELSGAALYNTKKDADGTKITAGNNEIALNSESDRFGRVKEKSIELRTVDNSAENQYTKIKTNYSYGTYNNSEGTFGKGNVQSILSTVALGENTLKDYEFSYEYDANGNITHEYSGSGDNRQLRYRYTYDEADQLVRVDDAVQNKTYVYAYDKGGNRETEKIYAFTTGDTLGEVLETKTSEYNYLVWKDRLSSFNGKAVKYDSAGNPTSYDGKTYKWDGRNLKEIALADGSKTQFEYDQDGLRTQKRQYKADGGLDYFVDYIWEDGKLVYQYLTLAVYVTNSQGVTTMHEFGPFTVKIIYDDSGLPQGFMVNDSVQYAFVRNLQGDVIAMIDQNGETVMEYSYDPWGKIEYHLSDESLTEQDAALITALCPLTYRGYNYDFTTGLYYLQSRYYNPEWGRFLNCDDTNILLATQGETHNANLFAYCDNNPVNRVDYTGYFGTYHTESTTKMAVNFFAPEYVTLLAEGSIYPDKEYPATRKFYNEYCQSFHFNTNLYKINARDSREIRYEEFVEIGFDYLDDASYFKAIGNQKKCKESLKAAFFNFGVALHPLQDMIAHSGPGGNFGVPISTVNTPGKIYISHAVYLHLGKKYDDPNGRYLNTKYTKGQICDFLTGFFCLGLAQELENRRLYYPLKYIYI